MNKTSIFLVFLLLFAQANSLFGMLGKRPTLAGSSTIPAKRPAVDVPNICKLRLCEFAGDVFSSTPEFASGWRMKDHISSKVSFESFTTLIQTFVNLMATQMLNDEAWAHNTIPAPSSEYHQNFTEYFNLDAKIYMDQANGRSDINHYPFVQKHTTLNENAKFACIGDLHGSLHSLLRILLNLYGRGYLNNDLEIVDNNFYLIFTGDLIDRGRHGTEVVYLTLLLKCLNPHNVFVLRGNHESSHAAYQYGFSNEIYSKFDNKQSDTLLNQLCDHVFNLFPYALFLTPNGQDYIQFCHGGIDPGFSPKSVIGHQKQSCFYMIPTTPTGHLPGEQHDCQNYSDAKCTNYDGLNWSDFRQESQNSDPENGTIYQNMPRGCVGYITDTIYTSKQYLSKNPGLRLIIRGHQDRSKSFKMFFSLGKKYEDISTPQGYEYRTGPYPWEMVASDNDYQRKQFSPCNYFPVLTCSTATEGQGVENDGFIILSTGRKEFNQWTVEVVEHILRREPSANGWISHAVVSPEGLNVDFFPAGEGQAGGLDVAIPTQEVPTPEIEAGIPVISHLAIQEDHFVQSYFDGQSPRYPWDIPLKVLKAKNSFDHDRVSFDRNLPTLIEAFKAQSNIIFSQIAEQLKVILDAKWEDGASCLSTSSKKIDQIVILQLTNNLMFQHYFEHYLRYFLCMLGLIDQETKIYSLMNGYSCEQTDSILLPEHQYEGYEPIRFFTRDTINEVIVNPEDKAKMNLIIGVIDGKSHLALQHYHNQMPKNWSKLTFPLPS